MAEPAALTVDGPVIYNDHSLMDPVFFMSLIPAEALPALSSLAALPAGPVLAALPSGPSGPALAPLPALPALSVARADTTSSFNTAASSQQDMFYGAAERADSPVAWNNYWIFDNSRAPVTDNSAELKIAPDMTLRDAGLALGGLLLVVAIICTRRTIQ